MKAQLLMLTAAGVLAASAAQAAPRTADELYLAAVGVHANARLARAGVSFPSDTLQVRAKLTGTHMVNVHVEPTGDPKADRAIEKALARMPLGDTPMSLDGADIVVTLARDPGRTP
jgi:hypothetical protein